MAVVLEASAVLQFAASTNETKRTARNAGTHRAALTVFRVMSADDHECTKDRLTCTQTNS